MPITPLQTLEIIEVMENFLSRIRPPEDIRDKLDIGYTIDNQSIIIFEIRPQWNKPEVIQEHPFAKTTFVKAKKLLESILDESKLKLASLFAPVKSGKSAGIYSIG